MQITVDRTGGLAGRHERLGPVETEEMEAHVRQRIVQEINSLDFFVLPEDLSSDAPVPDGFVYTIRVIDGPRRHTVRTAGLSHRAESKRLGELIGLLQQSGASFNGALGASHEESPLVIGTRDWSAWYNRMPGASDPDLHVSGICSLRSSSVSVRLEPGNEGLVDEPDLFVLQLVAEGPAIGDDLVEDREVGWQRDVGPNIRRVRIHGGPPEELQVFDAQ